VSPAPPSFTIEETAQRCALNIQDFPLKEYRMLQIACRTNLPDDGGVMKTKTSALKKLQQGFSLVELLVVIAVIAIIAAIAIPNIANITSQATVAKDQRNAQNIASVASAAKAAGVADDLHLKAGVIALLEGGTLTNTTGMKFGISPLSDSEETGALVYLGDGSDSDSAVVYTPGS